MLTLFLSLQIALVPPAEGAPRIIPPEAFSVVEPGKQCIVLTDSDLRAEGVPPAASERPAADTPPTAAEMAAYRERVILALTPMQTALAAASPPGGPYDAKMYSAAILAHREVAWKAIDSANTALLELLGTSPDSRRLIMRRAGVRLLQVDSPAKSGAHEYGVDAGLHLVESQDPHARALRTSLALSEPASTALASAVAAFDATAAQVRGDQMAAFRADARAAKHNRYDFASQEYRLLARRTHQRYEAWRRLNREFTDAVLAIATDANLRQHALEWRASIRRQQHPLLFGLVDTLTVVGDTVAEQDVSDWGAYQARLLACMERRDAAMRALAEAYAAAATEKALYTRDRIPAIEAACARCDRAIAGWETVETESAAALKSLLRDPQSPTAKAIDAHMANLQNTAWTHWRLYIDFCRPPSFEGGSGEDN